MIRSWQLALFVIFLGIICGCGGTADRRASAGEKTAAVSTPASTGSGVTVSGTIAPSTAPPAALVVLESATQAELPIKKEPAVVDQAGYEFIPPFLVAQAGQTVEFRNSEDVLHNVRVTETTTQKTAFNVATIAFGKYAHTLEPGYYAITCDIHPTMRSSILVIRTPYSATTRDDGGFSIENVVPGSYTLTVYAGNTPVVRTVEVKAGQANLGVIQ